MAKGILLTTTVLATGLAWAGGAAYGQDATAPTADAGASNPLRIDEIQIEGQGSPYLADDISSPKYTQSILDTPQLVTVITDRVMEEQQAVSLQEVFRNVPGISIQAGEGNPGAGDQFALRGFAARDDIFLDGFRDIGSYTRDPFNLEAVEFAIGPASVYQGRGSAGGSVTQVSKTPQLTTFVDLDGQLGTDDFKRTTLDVNTPLNGLGLDNTAVRLNVMLHDANVPGRDVIDEQRWAVAPSIAFGLGTPTQVTLSYLHMSQNNMPGAGIPNVRDRAFVNSGYLGQVAPVDHANFYGYTARDHEKIDLDVMTGTIAHEFNPALQVQNQTRFQRLKNQSAISSPRLRDNQAGQINSASLVRGQAKFRDSVDELLVNQTDLTARFATGSLRHTLVTGVEFGRQSLENERRLDADGPNTNLFNPNYDLPLTAAQMGVYNGTRAEASTDFAGIYISDTVDITDRWQVGGGLRYDYVRTRIQGIDQTGNFPGYVTDESRSDGEFSGRASITYKPVRNASIYVGYGNSFEPTLSVGTADSGVFQPAGGNNNPPVEAGFDAAPERTQTFELGGKWEVLEQRLLLSAAVFHTVKTNARDVDPVSGAVTVDGERRVNGLELSVNGAVTPNWNILAGYAFLDGKVTKSNIQELNADGQVVSRQGLALNQLPRHSFSAWTTYRFPWNITVGAGAQFVGDRTEFQGRTDRAMIKVDGYWKFDAMASYELNDNVSFRLNVLNLTDTKYIERVNAAQSIPGAGRAARVQASVRF